MKKILIILVILLVASTVAWFSFNSYAKNQHLENDKNASILAKSSFEKYKEISDSISSLNMQIHTANDPKVKAQFIEQQAKLWTKLEQQKEIIAQSGATKDNYIVTDNNVQIALDNQESANDNSDKPLIIFLIVSILLLLAIIFIAFKLYRKKKNDDNNYVEDFNDSIVYTQAQAIISNNHDDQNRTVTSMNFNVENKNSFKPNLSETSGIPVFRSPIGLKKTKSKDDKNKVRAVSGNKLHDDFNKGSSKDLADSNKPNIRENSDNSYAISPNTHKNINNNFDEIDNIDDFPEFNDNELEQFILEDDCNSANIDVNTDVNISASADTNIGANFMPDSDDESDITANDTTNFNSDNFDNNDNINVNTDANFIPDIDDIENNPDFKPEDINIIKNIKEQSNPNNPVLKTINSEIDFDDNLNDKNNDSLNFTSEHVIDENFSPNYATNFNSDNFDPDNDNIDDYTNNNIDSNSLPDIDDIENNPDFKPEDINIIKNLKEQSNPNNPVLKTINSEIDFDDNLNDDNNDSLNFTSEHVIDENNFESIEDDNGADIDGNIDANSDTNSDANLDANFMPDNNENEDFAHDADYVSKNIFADRTPTALRPTLYDEATESKDKILKMARKGFTSSQIGYRLNISQEIVDDIIKSNSND